MSKVTLERATLTDIADAIRTKGGTTDSMFPSQMADKIMDIVTDVSLQGYAYTSVSGNQQISDAGKLTNMRASFALKPNAKYYVVSLMVSRKSSVTPDAMLVTRMYGKNILNDTILEVKTTSIGLGVGKSSTNFTVYSNNEFSAGTYYWHFVAFWLE